MIRLAVSCVRSAAFAAALLCTASALAAERTTMTLAQAEQVKEMGRALVRSGSSAGAGYGEVWIRDYATFIRLSLDATSTATVKDTLRTFLQFQQPDGAIIDGYIPRDRVTESGMPYKFYYTPLAPHLAGHKNTVETDQESSLIQAVGIYHQVTSDDAFLQEEIGGRTVLQRLRDAATYLMHNRMSDKYQLLWGATTADWGDVQPEHPLGVELDENSHRAIDVYDNAMFILALDSLAAMDFNLPARWMDLRAKIAYGVMQHLWDETHQKFRPHIYLDGSPFPPGFDENAIFYHGGTAVAIQAGLLNREQIKASLDHMRNNVKKAGAATIGLSIYPPYPAGYFKNPIMAPYHYQNGGDWTWFGGRMVRELFRHGFPAEAEQELWPFVERTIRQGDFYEWHNFQNEPKGSAQYRGAAGVLYEAIVEWEKTLRTTPAAAQ